MLGFGSLLMDTSSELIHSLLPVFMASVLGTSMVTIGVVEGTAEAATSVMKVFSGALSDRLRRRKALVVLGYLLAAITKPAFPLASSIGWVFAARFVDRIGKGVREAPRDALMADVVSPNLRGAAYGLRQALDSVGAFCGPLLAVLLMGLLLNDIRAVMWAAVVPAFAAVLVLAAYVREPDGQTAAAVAPFTLAAIHRKLVADAAPPELRGTAFGVFNLCSGAALLVASPVAGILWSQMGPSITFLVGAGFAALSACGLLSVCPVLGTATPASRIPHPPVETGTGLRVGPGCQLASVTGQRSRSGARGLPDRIRWRAVPNRGAMESTVSL